MFTAEVAKLCRGWRSKLQRAFLSGKEAPKPEVRPCDMTNRNALRVLSAYIPFSCF